MAQISYGTITITDVTDIDHIENYYLATTFNSEIGTDNGIWGNWTPEVQTPNAEKPYLWNYEKILGANSYNILTTEPHIIGVFSSNGINGQPGANGRGIVSIQDYYLATDNSKIEVIFDYVLAEETSIQPNTTYYIKTQVDEYERIDNFDTGNPNPSSKGWFKDVYALTADTTPQAGVDYYKQIRPNVFEKIEDVNNKNPQEEGWFIHSYTAATETAVQEGVIYYAKNVVDVYTAIDNVTNENPYSSGWYKNSIPWSSEVEIIDQVNKYLWNYESITYTDGYIEYIGPRLLGVYGEQGIKGEDGESGTSSYIHIRYNNKASYEGSDTKIHEDTQYIGICSISSSQDPGADGDWKWSKYVGQDGASVERIVPLYYLKINSGSITTLEDGSEDNINNISVIDEWTTVIPDYQEGGVYYTCLQTFLKNTDESPIYSQPTIDSSLTDSKKDISILKTKILHFIYDPATGIITAAGLNNFDQDDVNTYGYNSIAAEDYFGLRYNDQLLTKLSTDRLEFYNPSVYMLATETSVQPNVTYYSYNPTTKKYDIVNSTPSDNPFDNGWYTKSTIPSMTLDEGGLTIRSPHGTQLAHYGETAVIGDISSASISIDKEQGIQFWIGEYNPNNPNLKPAATLNADALKIANTLTFDQMRIGSKEIEDGDIKKTINYWTWDFDENDSSIILKWIGELE